MFLPHSSSPHLQGEGDIDLRQHYFQQQHLFFGVQAVLAVVSVVQTVVLWGEPLRSPVNLYFFAMFIVFVSAAVSRAQWLHSTSAIIVLALLIGLIVTEMPEIAALPTP